jgi:hypothetical protein
VLVLWRKLSGPGQRWHPLGEPRQTSLQLFMLDMAGSGKFYVAEQGVDVNVLFRKGTTSKDGLLEEVEV